MPKFYTSVIFHINQSKEIGAKQCSVFGSGGGQNSPLMSVVPLETLCSEAYFSIAKTAATAKFSVFNCDGGGGCGMCMRV